MKKWKQKAIVQKTISYLPFGHKINFLFQKYVTKGVFLSDEYFLDRLIHTKAHLEFYKQVTGKNAPKKSLEIGTGWYPVVPICFFLSGSEEIISVDITFLTSKERLLTTIEKIISAEKSGQLAEFIEIKPERWQQLLELKSIFLDLTLNEALKKLNIVYHLEDATKLSFPSDYFDLVNSNNTFEHIYPEILEPILKEFKRVVKKNGGVMSHFIDMSDHFAHFDKSISIYHFLRFSDKQWKRIDNSIQPQNRLRIYDYRAMYERLGIPITLSTHRAGNLSELRNQAIDAKFSNYPLEEVAISHCHFVSAF